jgi:hypothetical protein
MASGSDKIYQLKLTPKQREEVRELTGKDAESVSLTIEELEDRIAPKLAAN